MEEGNLTSKAIKYQSRNYQQTIWKYICTIYNNVLGNIVQNPDISDVSCVMVDSAYSKWSVSNIWNLQHILPEE